MATIKHNKIWMIGGSPNSGIATIVAPIAPIYIYPSIPVFHTPDLIPIATPIPPSNKGEDLTRTLLKD